MNLAKLRRILAPMSAAVVALAVLTPTSSGALALGVSPALRADGAHVFTGGGFVPEHIYRTQLPEVVAHGTSLYVPMPILMIYPGPAVNPVEKRTVRATSMRSALRSLYLAAKEPSKGWGYVGIADAPTTSVRVTVDGKTRTTSVYALSMSATGRDITPTQAAARKRLRAAIDRLEALRGTSSTYQPAQLEAWVLGEPQISIDTPNDAPASPVTGPAIKPGDEFPGGPDLPWPLPSITAGCMVIDAASLPVDAHQASTWVSGEARFTAVFRMVLPGEVACKPEQHASH